MYINEGYDLLLNVCEINNSKKCKYFKKSSDVGEVMKEPKSVPELINKLENGKSNLQKFSDEEVRIAESFFLYNNYYKFSVFPKLLPKVAGKQYTFLESLRLYDLDNLLKRLLSPIVLQIEISMKARLASILPSIYESTEFRKAECYLDDSIYTKPRVCHEVLNSFSETIMKSKEPFIVHHHKGRHGCIPIWVITEEITFGQLDHFISSLNSSLRKKLLIEMYDKENFVFVISWISFVRHVRNITAHNSRLIGRKFVNIPKLKKEQKKLIMGKDNNSLIVLFSIFKEVITFESDNVIGEWNQLLDIFGFALEQNEHLVDYELNGFYDGWSEDFKVNK